MTDPPSSFQSHGVAQGRQFEQMCDVLLRTEGFGLGPRLRIDEIGVEIDRIATAPSGGMVWFEYKGSVHGTRPGLIRTDTLKKAVANGALIRTLEEPRPYVILASHLPLAGAGRAMLRRALHEGFFSDVICINDPHDVARLRLL